MRNKVLNLEKKFMILGIRRMINIKKNPDPDKGLRRAQDSI